MIDFNAGSRKVQEESGRSCARKERCAQKITGDMSKGHRKGCQLERDPTGRIWDNVRFKISN